MIETRIQKDPIDESPRARYDAPSADGEAGAHLVFYGRVRAEEEGRPITALDYEHYAGMAQRELQALAEETGRRFPLLAFECVHRVGRVAVGEASMRVVILARHRGESLEALAWFVRELKTRVPIWKWGVTADGERFPSHTRDTSAR